MTCKRSRPPLPGERYGWFRFRVRSTGLFSGCELRSAPFPDAARQNGYWYDRKYYPADPDYEDSSVAVFIPPGFSADHPVNLVFFFHGWNSTIDDAQERFDLYRQFSQSRVPGLLVIPEMARNAPDSFGGKLEGKGGFQRMVDELLRRLAADGVISDTQLGTIVLAGHSGAFEVIAAILMNGDLAENIGEIVLFDGLYAFTNQYRAWIEGHTGRFASVIAVDGEEDTNVDMLIARLRDDGVALHVVSDDPDMDSDALGSRVVFIKSTSDHFGVIVDHDEFRRLLSASPLLER